MIDVHIHILPGVDDGSTSWEESLEMARCASQDGIRTMVCTPHMDAESDDLAKLAWHSQLREEFAYKLEQAGIEMSLLAGAEWLLSPGLLEIVRTQGRLGTSRAFLFEVSPYISPLAAKAMLIEAVHDNLIPVFAHPERHPWIGEESYPLLQEFVSLGCLLQLTAGSLLGDFGRKAQKVSKMLALTFPRAVLLASDAHHAHWRKPLLREAYFVLESFSPGLAKETQQRIQALLDTT